jgi:hypothetical protein
MKKRNQLGALLGAGLLTFAVAGVAFASTSLLAGQVGITVGEKLADDTVCDAFPLAIGEGEVGLHFVLTQTSNTSGLLDATFSNPVGSVDDVASSDSNSATLNWYVVITGTADTVLESAETDADGNVLTLSHACFGAEVTSPPETAPPSFGGGGSEEVTQPPTDSELAARGASGPSDGAWLLVVALGVLLASVVVLTPARAKSKR